MAKTYQIALTNVDFDNSYNNSIRFNNRVEQEQYFDIENLSFSPYINFNFGSLLETKVTYKDTTLNAVDLLNKNYAIVKETIDDVTKYYYYFIIDSKFDTLSQIILDLELDIIQTYYIDIEFSDCLIERAHINRFKEVNNYDVTFNGDLNSNLYIRDSVKNLSKRLTHRLKLWFKYDTSAENSMFNLWLKNNVICWVYIFISPKDTGYTFSKWRSDGSDYTAQLKSYLSFNERGTTNFEMPYGILCYPIYKDYTKKIKSKWNVIINDVETTCYGYHDAFAFYSFREKNSGDSYIYQIKLSTVAPFKTDKYVYNEDYTIENGELILNIVDGYMSPFKSFKNCAVHNCDFVSNNMSDTIFNLTVQYLNVPLETNSVTLTQLNLQNYFAKTDIIGKNKNIKFNPKLLNEDYRTLRITNDTYYFEYDLQKLNKDIISFYYTELISADITKGYLRYKSDSNDNIYVIETNNNFTGLLLSQDNNIPYSKNQLDIYLANNKNFYLQRDIGMIRDIFKTVVNLNRGLGNSAMQLASGNVIGGGISGNKAVSGAITNTVDIIVNRINSNLTLDNMKNSPEMLENSNGNALFNCGINHIGLYVEIYSALENELKIANDYMHQYGFTYNQIDNIKNVDNIRVYFNYVKADVENITGINLSNTIKNKIREIFRNGIRLWNNTPEIFKYDKENYERWLTL